MAKQRVWESLGIATRRRYERAGVTPAAYAAGADLRAARGHSATPERPERAVRDSARYAAYINRQSSRNTVVLFTTNGVVSAYVPSFKSRSIAGKYLNRVTEIINHGRPIPSELGGVQIKGYRLTNHGYETEPSIFTTEDDESRLWAHVIHAADDGLIATSLYLDRAA